MDDQRLYIAAKLVCLDSSLKHVGGEGGHDLSVVGLDDSVQRWDGSRDCGLNEEAEETKHSKTSVVDFDFESTGLLFITGALVQAKRVVQVEWDRVGEIDNVEVGEVTGLSSSHVMLVVIGGDFGPKFQEKDESENLPLRVIGDLVPKLRRVVSRREWSSIQHHRPRPLDAVGVDKISDESEHGNTSVLDLGVTQETNSLFVGLSPELSFGQVQRIIESDNRVQLLGQISEIGRGFVTVASAAGFNGFLDLNRCARHGGGRHEGRSGRRKSKG